MLLCGSTVYVSSRLGLLFNHVRMSTFWKSVTLARGVRNLFDWVFARSASMVQGHEIRHGKVDY